MLDSVFWLSVLIQCCDSVPWFSVLIQRMIQCLDSVSWFSVCTQYLYSISWFNVVIQCMIQCLDSVSWFSVLIQCLNSVSWVSILVQWLDHHGYDRAHVKYVVLLRYAMKGWTQWKVQRRSGAPVLWPGRRRELLCKSCALVSKVGLCSVLAAAEGGPSLHLAH